MRRLLALLALVALAGCGSTVQVTGTSLGTPQNELGVPQPAASGGAAVANSPGGSGTSAPSAPGQGTAPQSTQSAAAPTLAARLGHVAPGAPVTIGIRIPNRNAGAVTGQLTGSHLDIGDPRAMAAAMVDWVNAHGGLAGHRVRPVYYENCAPLSCDLTVQDQQICAAFTQDSKVLAMVDSTETSVALASCLAHGGAASIGGGVAFLDAQDYRTAQGLFSPYLLPIDVAYTQLIQRLDATHWFATGDKVGLLAVDAPTYRRTAALAKRVMASLGRSFSDEAYWSGNPNDVSGIVLRFQAAGVKRIVIVDSGSQVLLQFGPAMSAQGYYPKVTVTSADVLGTLALIESRQTLSGAAGVGWMPVVDGAPDAPRPTSTSQLCARIYRAANVATGGPTAGAFATAYCDGFLFAQVVFARASGMSLGPFGRAVFGLGTSYVPATTFADRFTPGRYAGAAETRDVAYDTACSCFRYSGGAVPVA